MFDKKAYMKEYRKKHIKERNEYNKKYNREHKEKVNEHRRKYMKEYRERTGFTKRRVKNKNISKIKACSYMYVKYHFSELYNGKIHQIHHCYGLEKTSFVILYKQDHKKLHKIFGSTNDKCLISNEKVAKLISELPHILVKNGEIIENTMKSSEVTK